MAEYKRPKWEFVKGLSQRQCKLFTDSYTFFDGSRKEGSREIFSGDKYLADVLCYISTMAGYKTTPYTTPMVSKNCKIEVLYNVYVSSNKHKFVQRSNITEREFSGKLYCVEVPSGVFIIKDRRGNILPIGNCSGSMNFFAKKHGYERSGKLDARSWLKVGEVVTEPKLGDVVVFWRESKSSWKGHVGLYINHDTNYIYCLGGNQSGSIRITPYPIDRLLGYRRLKKV
jgi:uncharacterized protein (TIGR02594 family)